MPEPISTENQPSSATIHQIPKLTPIKAVPDGSFEVKRKSGNEKNYFLAFLLILIITICGVIGVWWWLKNNQTTTPTIIELTYWGINEPESVMQPLFDQFTESHPNIKINYINGSPSQYRQRLTNKLVSEDEVGPDIFRFHNTWLPMVSQYLATVPNSVYSSEEFAKTFYPVVARDLKRTGKNPGMIGLPLMIDGLGLYYNEDLFIAAQQEPPFDLRWENFEQLSRKLTTRDSGNNLQISGAALGSINNVDHWQDIIGVMLLQSNSSLAKPQDDPAVKAFSRYGIYTKGYKVWDETLPNSTRAFATGKLAMFLGTAADAARIRAIAKEQGVSLRFKIIPIPQLPEVNVTWANYWVEGVSNKTPKANQAAAWELLKFLSQKSRLERLMQLQIQDRGIANPPSRMDMAEDLKTDPYLSAFVLQAPAARSWYLGSDTTDVDGLNDKINKIYASILSSIASKDINASGLKKVTPQIDKVLKEYGLSS